MAKTGVKFPVADKFPPGTKVEITLRATDWYSAGGAVVKSTTIGQDGNLDVSGLDEHGRYWAAGDVKEIVATPQGDKEREVRRSVAFTAKGDDKTHPDFRHTRENTNLRTQAEREAAAEARREAEKKDPLVASPAPGRTVLSNVVTGARNTLTREPQPHPRQDQVPKGTPQRSDTPHGEATPKEVASGEPQPKVAQDQVPANTAQRSSTPSGEATPKPTGERQPKAKQGDVPKGTAQRSDTPLGEAEPKPPEARRRPSKKAAAKPRARVDSSASQARGRTGAKREEAVKPKAPATNTTKAGVAKRSGGKSKAGGSSRRKR